MTYRVREVDAFEAFEALAGPWNDLLAASALDTPFLRHEWLCNWWRHFGAGRRLAVMLVERDGQLVLGLPLMEVPAVRWGVPVVVLKSLTNHHSYRYGPLVRAGEAAAAGHLWRYLRGRPRRWHWIEMAQVPAHAGAHAPLAEAARAGGGRVEAWPGERSPYLPVQGTWDAYYASLKKGFRRGMRRRRHRIDELGPMAYDPVDDPAAVPAALTEALEIEARSWKGAAGTAILCDPVLTAFYSDWARVAAENGWLRLCFLTIAGRRVASEYALEYGGVRYSMKAGYDPEFSALSVGQFLLCEILERVFEGGLSGFDFLGDWDAAKGDWGPVPRPHLWVYIYNRGPIPAAARIYKFRVRRAAARWLRRGGARASGSPVSDSLNGASNSD